MAEFVTMVVNVFGDVAPFAVVWALAERITLMTIRAVSGKSLFRGDN